LSTVVGDIVKELDFSASQLCQYSKPTGKDGSKRRRTSMQSKGNLEENIRPLQPMLWCLETALKADSHDGGEWIRADDGRRFASLLTPLTALFDAKIPKDLPVARDDGTDHLTTTAYGALIVGRGTSRTGSLVGCLTALAAGGDNEWYWKPLAHAIV